MGARERLEQVEADAGGGGCGEAPAERELVGEGAGRQELHHDPVRPVVLGDVEDGDRAVVRHPGGGAGLAQRPLAQLFGGLAGLAGWGRDLLQGDVAAEQLVVGRPHRAHPPAAEHAQQPVAPGEQFSH